MPRTFARIRRYSLEIHNKAYRGDAVLNKWAGNNISEQLHLSVAKKVDSSAHADTSYRSRETIRFKRIVYIESATVTFTWFLWLVVTITATILWLCVCTPYAVFVCFASLNLFMARLSAPLPLPAKCVLCELCNGEIGAKAVSSSSSSSSRLDNCCMSASVC